MAIPDGEMSVLELIPSPCFVLEEAKLQRNLELLAQVQREAGIKIILALKGFAMFSAFPLIRQYLPGTTASSLHEAMLGKEISSDVRQHYLYTSVIFYFTSDASTRRLRK